MMKIYSESWLKFEEGLDDRPVLNGSAEEMRAQHGGLMSALAPQYPPNPDSIKSYDGTNGSFSYRCYCPPSTTDSLLPIGVYYHPGGLVIGPSIADEYFCADIASRNNTIIVAIKYRISPEVKAPVHLEDALRGFEWAFRNAAIFGGDATKMYAIGVSAGGGLALSVTRKVLSGQSTINPKAVRGVAVFSPVALHPDNIPERYRSIHTSSTENGEKTPLVDGISLRLFFDIAGLDADDDDYFPLLNPDSVKGFPPTYVSTCELDSLRDDGRVLEQSLKDAGISVNTDHYPGLPHCFWIVPQLPETSVFMTNARNGLQWIIDQL